MELTAQQVESQIAKIEKIYELMSHHQYDEALDLLQEYFKDELTPYSPVLQYKYAICLIRLGQSNEALAVINILQKKQPGFFPGNRLIELAMICCNELNCALAKEILLQIPPYNRFYEKAQKILTIIETFEKSGEIPTEFMYHQSYKRFKEVYGGLHPGCMVKAAVQDTYIENKDNPLPENIPVEYLIWDIDYETGKIYAFPIVGIGKKRDRILYPIPGDNYGFQFKDTVPKDNLRVLEEEDIWEVTRKLTNQDYMETIISIYSSLLIYTKGVANEYNKYFMDKMHKWIRSQIKPGRIIRTINVLTKRKSIYYVFDVDYKKRQYRAIKIDNLHNPVSDGFEEVLLPIDDTHICNVFEPINKSVITKLQEHLPDEYRASIVTGVRRMENTRYTYTGPKKVRQLKPNKKRIIFLEK